MKALKSKKSGFRNEYSLYIMLAPFTVMFLVFMIVPIISSVVLSFTSFDMIHKLDFVGLDNYFRMFVDDEVFMTTVKNTILFSVFTGPFGFILSFVLAWFINEFKPFARTLLSFLFYAPALVGNAYYIWQIQPTAEFSFTTEKTVCFAFSEAESAEVKHSVHSACLLP